MKVITICLIVLLMSACSERTEPKIFEKIETGNVITADVVPTSFNESIKTTIKTEKGVFTVTGMPSVLIGKSTWIDRYDNGRSYLCVESWNRCRRIYNY